MRLIRPAIHPRCIPRVLALAVVLMSPASGFADALVSPAGDPSAGPAKSTGFMHARYYSPNVGRFLSVDPVGGDIGSSQSWNRYSYAQNSPTRIIDPDGRANFDGLQMQNATRHMSQEERQAYIEADVRNSPRIAAAEAAAFVAAGAGLTLVELAPVALTYAMTPQGQKSITAGLEFANPNPGPLTVGGTARLARRATQVHEALDPIAQTMRTTAVLETTAETIVAGGARDLTPAQRAVLGVGEAAANLPGAHAEVTALAHATESGLLPKALAVTRDICPSCAAAIEKLGGVVTGARTAEWPEGGR